MSIADNGDPLPTPGTSPYPAPTSQPVQPVLRPLPEPERLTTPVPSPSPRPSPLPTAGEFRLSGAGKDVTSVEIIGHPVDELGAKQLHSLHLAEVITYGDGTRDVVGYFPEGKSIAHSGDPMYPATKLDGETKAQYLKSGREHYVLDVSPTAGQSLTALVATQERSWAAARSTHAPPFYDFAGNDLHNSNGAMVASLSEAGRPDIAVRLANDLEPPGRIAQLERDDHLSQEAAGMRLTLERKNAFEPSAPGASNALTNAQIEGLATADPPDLQRNVTGHEIAGGIDAFRSLAVQDSNGRSPDALDAGPASDRSPDYLGGGKQVGRLVAMHTDAHGVQSLMQRAEPLSERGIVEHIDRDRVTLDVGGGAKMTYRTTDLLSLAGDGYQTMAALENAAKEHASISIGIDAQGLNIHTLPAPELHVCNDGHAKTVGSGYHETGKVFNYGHMVGVQTSTEHALTMYSRKELLELTPEKDRPELTKALRDGHTLDVSISGKGLVVHDVTPAHQLSAGHERDRALEQSKGHGIERDR